MTGQIIYYICDACKRSTLQEPDMEMVFSGAHRGVDYHVCADCADADWFYCETCKQAHQFECPIDAAKLDAEWREYEAACAATLAKLEAQDDALEF